MKTKILLAMQIFGLMVISLVSCSKEEDTSDYLKNRISAPSFIHVIDTVYTPIFSSGKHVFNDYVYWGNEKGEISISNPSSGIKIATSNYILYELIWDEKLALGKYPITVTAKNSMGTAEDHFVLVSNLAGSFARTYNYDPESMLGMSRPQTISLDHDGNVYSHDSWDYGNSIVGKWAWVSQNEIQGSYTKDGETEKYSFKATMDYDKETDLLQLNGYWYLGAKPVPGEEKGSISFQDDRGSRSLAANIESNQEDANGSESEVRIQPDFYPDPLDKDTFAGWFTAICHSNQNSKSYRLYLGADKKIFRGTSNDVETWSWVSDNEIQGTFLVRSDFEGEDYYITFKGKVSQSTDGRRLPTIRGQWYYGKEIMEGVVAGEFIIEYEDWFSWYCC